MPVVVVACVVALFAPLAGWWVGRAGDADAFGGVCVFVAGVVVGVVGLRRPPAAPQTPWASLLVGALASLAGVALDVRIAQMAGALCLAHVAVALCLPGRARALLPALWLCLLGLPLAGDLDVVGFGARVFAARVAQATLAAFGTPVASAETVLVVEGNVADIEAPCAGLSTLRMLVAVVLVLGALRRTGHGQLVLAVVVAGAVAVVSNAARVTALAALVLVARRPDLAALVHVPLGVVAFCVAVVVADRLLRPRAPPASVPGAGAGRRACAAVFVVVTAATTLLRTATPPRPTLALSSSSSSSSSAASSSSIPLTPAEQALFARHALAADKRLLRAADDGADGSALVVIATSLRAHHAPERCLAGSGLRVDASTETVIAGVPVKRLVLDGGAHLGVSFYVRVDDEGAHVFATLLDRTVDQLAHRGPWAFVSAVVDGDADDAGLDVLVTRLLDDVRRRLRPSPASEQR